MANYHTEAAFIIPCTAEQGIIAVNALEHINQDFTELAEHAIAKGDGEQLSAEEKIIRHCFISHPCQDSEYSQKELDWDFSLNPVDEGLLVTSDQSINTEHAAVFAQAVLRSFDLSLMVIIQAAHTCDKNKVDAFGGHGVVVTKDWMRWDTIPEWIDAEVKAHNTGDRYYACHVTRQFGESEELYRFLMVCEKAVDPQDKIVEVVLDLHEGGESTTKGHFIYADCTGAKKPVFQEITPMEFKVMSPYSSVY